MKVWIVVPDEKYVGAFPDRSVVFSTEADANFYAGRMQNKEFGVEFEVYGPFEVDHREAFRD